MKRILLISSLLMCSSLLFAQDTDSVTVTPKKNTDQLKRRAADHFMFQYGYHGWSGAPDSLRNGGYTTTFNLSLLYDFRFKSSPKYSVAVGVGVGWDNMYFKNTTIDLRKYPLSFANETNYQYKRYKLATSYLEVPLELRYALNPEKYNSTFKVALGVKVGTQINAYTRAKITRDPEGYGGYTTRLRDKRNFNSTRLAGTLRVGYGPFSVFGTYHLNEFFREGAGPDVRPYSVGIAVSGL
ncbi:MAG: outer membrane beta-barrel protein [Chitinophagaceae bacterium]|nr:outer membrane beta-barrel protein [Chitinophagaceae bacterium]MCW5925362.1 outer membrane beta-barrel protein [Chitinophagaceae bacterium]